MEPLRVIDKQKDEEVKLYKMILDLMSFEKVVIAGMFLLKGDFQLNNSMQCFVFSIIGMMM